MMPTIVSSLILLKKRRMMNVFPPGFRKQWKEWELRGMVLFSLTSQIVLIHLGNRRRYIPNIWIRIVVWSAYLLADSVATIALGILSNDLGEIYDDGGSIDSIEPENEITAFWAPFFLLHLGGPDTITAYSLEDNELYLRHLLGLAVQTIATMYIFLMAWNGSHLSILAIPMILVGCIKYGERTWALWSASSDELRDSMITPADPGPNYPKFMDEYSLKHAEGYCVKAEEVHEVQVELDITASGAETTHNVIRADALFQTFKCLFADLILSFQDRDNSQSLFRTLSHKDAFNVIAIELGFMYDLLYTKATVIYTYWGFARRIITFTLTCLVLVIFSIAEKQKYSKLDLSITFLLLAVAILLEIYAALLLLFSDQTNCWLIKHKKTTILQLPAINCLEPLAELPRWSNSMAQYSLLSLCLKEKPGHKILRLSCIDKLLEKHRYKTYREVPDNLKESIFKHIREKLGQFKEKQGREIILRDLCSQRGIRILEKYSHQDLDWSLKVEFDQSILIWNIATELCYYYPDNQAEVSDAFNKSNVEMSIQISRYMLYLLVMYPFMLPVGIGLIRFRDTCAEYRKFFEERMPIFSTKQIPSTKDLAQKKEGRLEACRMLLQVKTHVLPIKVKGDRSKSVLFDACRLASALNGISNTKMKWEMIRDVWLEMLTYAASQCKGSQHAQQLRRGGELLTHVWLLMAHFGMTEQFQISQGHARAKLIVK